VSVACREALAAVADAGGEAGLAAALRTKSFETTRKRDLMRMAAAWGYRSRVWQMKAGCKRKREREGAAAAAAAAAGSSEEGGTRWTLALRPQPRTPPLPPPCPLLLLPSRSEEERLRCVLLTQLRPLAGHSVESLRGHAARAALHRCGAANAAVFVTPWSVQYNAAVGAFVRSALLPRAEAETLTLRTWQLQTAALGPGAASAPAWASLAGRESPPDRVLAFSTAFHARCVDIQARLRHLMRTTAAAAAPGSCNLDPAETNLEELQHTMDYVMEFLARMRALLASAALLGFGAYCALAIEAVEETASLLLRVGDASSERADWMAAFVASAPKPPLPLPAFSEQMAGMAAA
jgi:hypothetical protein